MFHRSDKFYIKINGHFVGQNSAGYLVLNDLDPLIFKVFVTGKCQRDDCYVSLMSKVGKLKV